MAYGKDKKRNNRKKGRIHEYFLPDEVKISREKEKARKLRDSSWWRKKCATGICNYCGKKIPFSELTMDHVIPLSRGGTSERFNIVPACKDCNNKKKYLLPSEWKEYLENMNKNNNIGLPNGSERQQ